MPDTSNVALLEERLNHPEHAMRLRALHELKHLADAGKVSVEPERPWVNVHCHSTYSYNAHGFSVSRVAWECYKRGLAVGGIVDFDVLDGVDEALEASDALHCRFTAGLESRVYVEDFDGVVLNSPNEPAIAYTMGQGFVGTPMPGSRAERTLKSMASCAAKRNRALVERVNAHLEEVVLDYERDVLSLTPSGNATERHICEAYDLKGREVFPDPVRRARFWAGRLFVSEPEVARVMDAPVPFRDMIRKKLMKYGSPGYATPEPTNFPTLAQTVSMVRESGAMPMYAWADGTSPGEEDVELLLDYFRGAGQVGINIVPDRNWNLRDPDEKARKVLRLNEIVKAARGRHLPISVGTEMNRATQPMVDRFDAPELKPHAQTFLEGARIIWGHSLLMRHGAFGYLSEAADEAFRKDPVRKNAFFAEVGARPVPHGRALAALRAACRGGSPKAILSALKG